MMLMMKQEQMIQTRRHKQFLLFLFVSGIYLTLFSGCNLERFRHEKYMCNHARLDVYEIIVREAKKGRTVKIIGSNGERQAVIMSVNSKLMVLQSDEVSFQIDRKTGRVTVQKRNKYYSLQCKPSVFTL